MNFIASRLRNIVGLLSVAFANLFVSIIKLSFEAIVLSIFAFILRTMKGMIEDLIGSPVFKKCQHCRSNIPIMFKKHIPEKTTTDKDGVKRGEQIDQFYCPFCGGSEEIITNRKISE